MELQIGGTSAQRNSLNKPKGPLSAIEFLKIDDYPLGIVEKSRVFEFSPLSPIRGTRLVPSSQLPTVSLALPLTSYSFHII